MHGWRPSLARDMNARMLPNNIPHNLLQQESNKKHAQTRSRVRTLLEIRGFTWFQTARMMRHLEIELFRALRFRGTLAVYSADPPLSLPVRAHTYHSRSSAARRLQNEPAQQGAFSCRGSPFLQRGHCSTMGLPFGKKKADTGDKKDLKANYTTEDHKTDLSALLASLNTHPTQVGLRARGCSTAPTSVGTVGQPQLQCECCLRGCWCRLVPC